MTAHDLDAQFRASIVIDSEVLGLERLNERMGRSSDVASATSALAGASPTASTHWSIGLSWPEGSHPGTDGLDRALATLGWRLAERAGALAAEGCRVELRVHQVLNGTEGETGVGLSRGALQWLDTAGASFDLHQHVGGKPGEESGRRPSVLIAALTIESEVADVAHISAAVGREPDSSYEIGEIGRWTQRPRTTSRWTLDLDWPTALRPGVEGLSFAITSLGSRLAEGASTLSHSGATVLLGLYQDLSADPWGHGIRLSRDAIGWLVTAGADLDIDQYAHGQYIAGVLDETDLVAARVITPEEWAVEAKEERRRIEERWRRV